MKHVWECTTHGGAYYGDFPQGVCPLREHYGMDDPTLADIRAMPCVWERADRERTP